VENAFKHGIEPAEKDCFLHLSLSSNTEELTFTCTNSIEEKTEAKEGTGLKNLQRRLALRFPNRHDLNTEITQDSYTTTLKIKLT